LKIRENVRNNQKLEEFAKTRSKKMKLPLDGFMKTTTYRKRLQYLGVHVPDDNHVCHVIPASNGGPNHSINYFIASEQYNLQTKNMQDEIN